MPPNLTDGAARAAVPAGSTRIDAVPLAIAVAITGAMTVYPYIATSPDGRPDHLTAVLLLWSMSAGYVRGVGSSTPCAFPCAAFEHRLSCRAGGGALAHLCMTKEIPAMYFRQIADSTDGALTYLLGNLASQEAVVIDPAVRQQAVVRALLAERKLALRWILCTHCHGGDDSAALASLCAEAGAVEVAAAMGG